MAFGIDDALLLAGTAYSAYQASKGSKGGSSGGGYSDANAFNSAEAQKQRDWEEMMYKNRHQFEVADLRAAGLNPILSAGGQPPIPSGQSAASVTPNYSVMDQRTRRMEFAVSAAKALSEVALNRSAALKNVADASGSAGIPGFLKVPLNKAQDWLSKNSENISSFKGKAASAGQALLNFVTSGSFGDPVKGSSAKAVSDKFIFG